MSGRATASNIDEYISAFPAETKSRLEQIREVIRELAPDAVETISYSLPTFDLDGRHLVHFAGYDRHIGFYPIPSAMEAFKDELKGYKQGRGSVQFPLNEPLPIDLIRRMVEFRVAENQARKK